MSRFLGPCKVMRNDEIGESVYLMELESKEIASSAEPGQFVHLRVSSTYDPLLRRPFSIHDTSEKSFKIVYDVVGKGSRMLSETKPGAVMDVLGPLGSGFEIAEAKAETCVIAGGMGIAPLVFLARRLKERTDRIIGFVGARSKSKLVGDAALRSLGIEVFTATEDGSVGFSGLVTELFEKVVERRDLKGCALFACGPKEMLRALARMTVRRSMNGQVSLEEFMACGVGACLGCAVKLRSGEYRMTCRDGPVFRLDEVAFDG